ncbi:NUDIX hydrolase domain-like protein [Pelagophyceae sp. CCMP2097]|nr:NUDIX hydrolase domain-like protein [Pelagophyceae sp. CCMP2097]|mmetsp:Transcript_15105/g.50726  ORF Transcript_15105/g.50726 Transcript_15105/m.50726 type:complete len:198 (-) Transcript_15105:111-704(-)
MRTEPEDMRVEPKDLNAVARPVYETAWQYLWRRARHYTAFAFRRYLSGAHKRRAGGIVVRQRADGVEEEVLLISSRKRPDVWIIPAGTVERGETLDVTALREVSEEAGVACSLVYARALGTYSDDDRLVVTSIFVMRVEHDAGVWEYMDSGRKRQWWPVSDAVESLKPRDRAALLDYIERQKRAAAPSARTGAAPRS